MQIDRIVIGALLAILAPIAPAQENSVTYQGRLLNAGIPVSGPTDLTFSLWDAASNGSQVGPSVILNDEPIDDGLVFSELDFGLNPYNGERWLQIVVDGVPLSPRQKLTLAPKAMQLRGIHIDNDGFFGINTTNPNAKLHVEQDDNLAIYGQSLFEEGIVGVTASAGKSGILGIGTSPDSFGVRGRVDASPGTGRGVYGRSFADQGVGVYGEATNTSGIGHGVYGTTVGTQSGASGVFGHSTSRSGNTRGGTFLVESSEGGASGIVAQALASSGTTFGVQASTASPDGRAVSGFVGAPSGGVAILGSNNNADGWAARLLGRVLMRDHTVVGRGGVRVTSAEQFGVHTTAESGQFGGMYISGQNAGAFPFYGYSTNGTAVSAYHYFDGQSDRWRLWCGSERMTINRSNGYVGFGDPTPDFPLDMTSGAHVTAGGVWTNASSRELKQDFEPIDASDILERVLNLPISEWAYISESDVRHLGPVAEDFAAAFDLGGDNKSIGTIDADGVALAAIQGLHHIVEQKDAKITDLQTEVESLNARLERLESLLISAGEDKDK